MGREGGGSIHFGEIVRSHRRRLGLSQEELATRVGLSVRALRKIEGGQTAAPRAFTVRLLADAFGLTAAERDRFSETASPVVPAQLPPPAVGFVGRDDELDRLDAVVFGDAAITPVVTIVGTAGVGKSALALHWAHRVRARFPDGQLFVDLRGFDPSGEAASPGDALRGVLESLLVAPAKVPAGLDARAALYRSLVADRRMLILLDNARDADQVRPLLPGSPGCAVLVTSRQQLAGLVALDGAYPLLLAARPLAVIEDLVPEPS